MPHRPTTVLHCRQTPTTVHSCQFSAFQHRHAARLVTRHHSSLCQEPHLTARQPLIVTMPRHAVPCNCHLATHTMPRGVLTSAHSCQSASWLSRGFTVWARFRALGSPT